MLVFHIKIILWSYFYVTFNCSYKFIHFSPVTIMLISLMILTLYVCLYYCQKLINLYWKSGQCLWCHATYLYKNVCCSNIWLSLFANKNISASLCIHIYALVNWYWKGWRISFSFFLNFPLLAKSLVDDGVSEIFVTARGCPAAVVRLWHTIDGPPLELCGVKQLTDRWQYLSEDNSMQIRYRYWVTGIRT